MALKISPVVSVTSMLVVMMVAVICLPLISSSSASSSSSMPSSHQSSPSIINNSRHIRSSGQLPPSSSASLLFRSKRAPWEWMIDALKCTMKIMSGKLSRYHNNKIMCCTLWMAKKFLKKAAEETCERPQQSIKVFEEIISEQLIYSDFTKAMLGDPNLDCSRYPENSSECDAMVYMFVTSVIFILFLLVGIVIGLVISVIMCFRWRRSYFELLRAKELRDSHSIHSFDEKAKFLNNTSPKKANSTKQKLQNMLNGGSNYLLPQKNNNKLPIAPGNGVNGASKNGTNMGYVSNRSNNSLQKTGHDGSELELTHTRNTTPTTDGRSSSASTETSTATA